MAITFVVGSKVKFRGVYKENGVLAEPANPRFIITTTQREEIRDMASGLLEHDGPGSFSTVVIVLYPPMLAVRFVPDHGPGEAFAREVYRVTEPGVAAGASPSIQHASALQARADSPPVDTQRAHMIRLLQSEGIRIDESDSDRRIESAYNDAMARRTAGNAARFRQLMSPAKLR